MHLRGLVSPGRRPGGPPHVNLRMLGPQSGSWEPFAKIQGFPGLRCKHAARRTQGFKQKAEFEKPFAEIQGFPGLHTPTARLTQKKHPHT